MSVVNWADCLVAMQQREIDAVSTDDSILAGLVEEDPYLHIVGRTWPPSPTASGST
ncbi:putative glutamine-binding lipoprotein glnH [Mycobacterium avium MAV_120809_2495]|nr:putative glutamine-binding lipoprotein glnH [Mycobacterium avium MAV_120809_2495]